MQTKKKKTIPIIAAAIIVIWLAVGVLNFFEVRALKTPSLSWKAAAAEDAEEYSYLGVGYSFTVRRENGKNTYIEMYALGFTILKAGEK